MNRITKSDDGCRCAPSNVDAIQPCASGRVDPSSQLLSAPNQSTRRRRWRVAFTRRRAHAQSQSNARQRTRSRERAGFALFLVAPRHLHADQHDRRRRHVVVRGGASRRCRPILASLRGDASLAYTLLMVGFALGSIGDRQARRSLRHQGDPLFGAGAIGLGYVGPRPTRQPLAALRAGACCCSDSARRPASVR